jgi:unsaturated rhamnogalacturonyl hydrolase
VQNVANNYLLDSGHTIKTYKVNDFNLDNILGGNMFLSLYQLQVTDNRNYFNAVQVLYQQLMQQPRIYDCGFWHKARCPQQMWLDGMYMAQPFYTRYGLAFHQPENFNDIAMQFLLITHKTRNKENGLLYHAWDADYKQKWSNPATGTSSNFWGRAMGWYGKALVDVLENFPVNNVYYDSLKGLLSDYVKAVAAVQDVKTGIWWNVLNYANKDGNDVESSASCMFTYTIAKALRFKWIDEKYKTVINTAYEGIVNNFIIEKNDSVFLTNTVKVSGVGGNPYRDGSYQYYCSEPVVTNDSKGISAFILMDIEMALYKHSYKGKGITVVLDAYFNAEKKVDIPGSLVPYHYKWNEMNNGGFSTLQFLFQKYGITTKHLAEMPSKNNLPLNSIYLIVDADDSGDNPNPNFMNVPAANFLRNWVNKGGVLCVLHNDKGNAEFKHMNLLLSLVGIEVNTDSYQHFSANQLMKGVINVHQNNEELPNAQ